MVISVGTSHRETEKIVIVVFPTVSSSLTLGPVSIYWYGLLVVAGIVAGYAVVQYLARRGQACLASTEFDNLFFHLIIWGFIGARLYHVLNEPAYYWNNPIDIFKIWNGGLAIHGAILAGLLVVLSFVRKEVFEHYRDDQGVYDESGIMNQAKDEHSSSAHNTSFMLHDTKSYDYRKRFFTITDLLAVGLAIGQAIGRWGNYFNQELFGKPTDGFFKVAIDAAHRPTWFEGIEYFHPTFFYESVLNLVLFFVLLWGYMRHREDRAGIMTAGYLLGYGLIRFFVDFYRIDPRPFFGGLYLSQWVSLGMIVMGIVVWYTTFSQQRTKNSKQ